MATGARRRTVTTALIFGFSALMGGLGAAAPVKDPVGTPGKGSGSQKLEESAIITEKTVTVCDVMQDYYYDSTTGEFLGWAAALQDELPHLRGARRLPAE
jgi:hypothetical protein